MITLGEGLHPNIRDEVYHADPAPQASLSSTVARLLVDKSPLHARVAHPRLNPVAAGDAKASNDRVRDMGSAAHVLMLGTGREIVVVPGKDYKKDAAKNAAKEARAAGHLPLLQSDLDEVHALVDAGKTQLAQTDLAGIFNGGDPEMTLVWQETKPQAWCRCRFDYLPRIVHQGGHVIVPDYKTTGGSAHPDDFARTIFEQGYDVQAAFYERGLRKLIPSILSIQFVFIVQEQDPPYALSIVGLDGRALEMANERADIAIRLWSTCISTDTWPGYSPSVSRVELPNWRAERTELNNMVLLDRLAKWQSPLHNSGEAA